MMHSLQRENVSAIDVPIGNSALMILYSQMCLFSYNLSLGNVTLCMPSYIFASESVADHQTQPSQIVEVVWDDPIARLVFCRC
jgi:hypothetical protein